MFYVGFEIGNFFLSTPNSFLSHEMFGYNLGSRLCQLSWLIDPFCVALVSKQNFLWLPIYTLTIRYKITKFSIIL